MSPDVFEDNFAFHYIFPIQAVSSITNRVTGCMIAGELGILALVTIFGDLHAFIDVIKSTIFLAAPAKFFIAFPITYHSLGGLRHLMWDFSSIGNQSSKNSSLEKGATAQQSALIVYGSAAISLIFAFYSTGYKTPLKDDHKEEHH